MRELIENRVNECTEKAEQYERWLRTLRYPNLLLIGGGSLMSFLGGAAIISSRFEEAAGYLAIAGGAFTGLHAWLGCETYQQKCRAIESSYRSFTSKYELLLSSEGVDDTEFRSLDSQYSEFVQGIDVKPW